MPLGPQKKKYLANYNNHVIELDPDEERNKWRRGEIANKITRFRQEHKMYFSAVRWLPHNNLNLTKQQLSIRIDEPLDVMKDQLTTKSDATHGTITPVVQACTTDHIIKFERPFQRRRHTTILNSVVEDSLFDTSRAAHGDDFSVNKDSVVNLQGPS